MSKPRNATAVAMMKRYGKTNTVHKDRRDRRAKDARKSWKNEVWS
jgi:hypothetical protein